MVAWLIYNIAWHIHVSHVRPCLFKPAYWSLSFKCLEPEYTVVYVCTLQARSVKSRFLRTHKSSTYRSEKAILAQKFEHGEDRFIWAKCISKFLYLLWSIFYSQIQLQKGRKIICQFLTGYSFKGRRNLKNLRQIGSLGSALSADVSQISIPQTQGYKIAFEGVALI